MSINVICANAIFNTIEIDCSVKKAPYLKMIVEEDKAFLKEFKWNEVM